MLNKCFRNCRCRRIIATVVAICQNMEIEVIVEEMSVRFFGEIFRFSCRVDLLLLLLRLNCRIELGSTRSSLSFVVG